MRMGKRPVKRGLESRIVERAESVAKSILVLCGKAPSPTRSLTGGGEAHSYIFEPQAFFIVPFFVPFFGPQAGFFEVPFWAPQAFFIVGPEEPQAFFMLAWAVVMATVAARAIRVCSA